MNRRQLAAVGIAAALMMSVAGTSVAAPDLHPVNPAAQPTAVQPPPIDVGAADVLSPTDVTKIPHYFGPYPNYANSPQSLANAIVTIGLGTPTPVAYGNPLVQRSVASDFATAAGTLAQVLVVLRNDPLPAGTLTAFQTWNQVVPGAGPGPSAGHLLYALVLRPTATPDQYTVVYNSGELTIPAAATGTVETFPVPNLAVQANDVLAFYGQGIPLDTGIAVTPDTLSYPASADATLATAVAPALSDTINLGTDANYPILSTDREYSFGAIVTPTVADAGTGATADATVDPKTGGISAITVTSPGAGYVLPPTVTITAPGLTPTPAAATATISQGVLTDVAVNESGFGFSAPTVIFGGGGFTTQATAVASGGVDNVTIVDGGSYATQPLVVFSMPDLAGGVQATGSATMDVNGVVTAVDVVDPGSGYSSAPSVTIWDGDLTTIAPVPAVTSATIGILGVSITSGGTGYDTAPTVTISDTVGTPDKGASATATVAVKGAVTAITVTAPGAGYITPGIKKFVDTLPGLGPTGANNLGNYIPVAVPDTTTYPGADYYEIGLVQYHHQFHSNLPPTLMRGYVQLSTSVVPGAAVPLMNEALTGPGTAALLPDGTQALGVDSPHYLGPTIIATKDRAVRITFRNLLPTGVDGDLFLPVDTSLMGAGEGPGMITLDGNGVPQDMAVNESSVIDGVRNPQCAESPKNPECFTENRATLHLHGGITPWISDGTPHQWTTPADPDVAYPRGVSVSNVPDMPDPGPGALTFFYTNQQSARLMFYHDHAWGLTRLNVYAGEAAGYLVTDAMEQSLIAPGGALDGLGVGTPLIIQDKTFVPDDATMAKLDPTWDKAKWGGIGSLWAPHVYMPAQNPADPSGMSAFGRWMYGPWFWPPATGTKFDPIPNPYYDPACNPNLVEFCEPDLIPGTPNVSVGMEAFNDTPLVNGAVYPKTQVDPKAYRFRILNAANDRFWNLSWYVADPTTGTLSEVALKPAEVLAAKTDTSLFPTPDETKSPKGPNWIQIGTEGGFLPTPVVLPAQPTTWITDPTRFDVGNVDLHSLLLAPAERADVIVDFSAYRGKTLILYNDAPAAFPARVACYDYYTDNADLTPACAPTTLPGYGPNTRTIMQVKVSTAAPATAWDRPNTTSDRMGTLMAAFGHHLDANGDPAGVFESSMDPIVVGQAAYNDALGTNFVASGWCNSPNNPSVKCDGFARINEQGGELFKFDTVNGPQLSIPLQPKGIHDEMNSATFDPYGRMTANLGLEVVPASPATQNIVLYPYVNPVTEILDATGMPSSLDVTPISVAADGTQIWKITHNGVDTHPIHWHLYNVQVLNRVAWDNNLQPPDPEELGWKETVRISPLQDTYVALRPIVPELPFAVPDSKRPYNPMMPIGAHGDANTDGLEAGFNNTDPNGIPTAPIVNQVADFNWEYVFHCHILSHEEMDMMRTQSVIVPSVAPAAPVLTLAKGSVILNWTDGTPVDYLDVATWGNVQNEVGFKVERSTDGGAFVLLTTSPANTTTYTDLTAVANGNYEYRVTAFNEGGSAASNVASAAPPAAPVLTATTISSSQIDLSWPDVLGETSYTVERCQGAGCSNFLPVGLSLAANTVSYPDMGLAPATSYSYRVFASNLFADSAFSNVATAVTQDVAPAAPTNLVATATGTTTIDLTWTDNAANETSYRVERCTGAACVNFAQVGASQPAGTVTFGDTLLSPNTAYSYRVFAVNAVGDSLPSNVATATTFDLLPAAPTGLTATAFSSSQINLAWTDVAINETGYRVESCLGAGCTNFALLTTLGAGAVAFSDTGLLPATTYRYQVFAFNGLGDSAPSNIATATTLDVAPAAPTAVSAVAYSPTRVDLTWLDNSTNETGFTIQRSTNVNFTFAVTITLNTPNAVSYSNTGRTPGTTYYYRIRAFNAVGFSAWSNFLPVATTGTAPAAPSLLAAPVVGTNVVGLTWQDNATNEVGFQVQRSTNVGFAPAATITLATPNLAAYTDNGRTPDTTYYYRVRAYNGFGNSLYSNTVTVHTVPVIGAVPTAVLVTPGAAGSLVIGWTYVDNGAPGLIGFDVQRSNNGVNNWTTVANDTAVNPFTNTGLPTGQTRFYRVRTVTAAGNSAYSAPVSGLVP